MTLSSPRKRAALSLLLAVCTTQVLVLTAVGPASAAPKPTATKAASASDEDFARQVVELTNKNRREKGCEDLKIDPLLTKAAQGHSEDMAEKDYLDHDGKDGRDPGQRIEDAGYDASSWAENIAAGQKTPEKVVDVWMHSEGHRENILDCDLEDIGVGFAKAEHAEYSDYWTQNFGTK